jgi:eukaryotic-like serine/threonine-protein kinase
LKAIVIPLLSRVLLFQEQAEETTTMCIQKGSLMRDWTGQQVGNYHVLRLLEHGTGIDRYLSYDVSSQRQITLFLLAASTDEAGIFRFQRNLPIIKHLVHPHIASLLDAGVQDMTPFVALDHLPTSRQAHPLPLPIPTIVQSVSQLADAFDTAHNQGVWHTYTAPETILLGPRSEALLGGFGIRLLEISQAPGDGRWECPVSPAYLAPEQVVGGFMDRSIDQYALAVVVYEWLCGVPPFQGATPLEITVHQLHDPPPSLRAKMPTVPVEMERVLIKALAKKPEERFATIQAFSHALREASQKAVDGPIWPT